MRRQGQEAVLKQGISRSQQNSLHTGTRKTKTFNLQTYKLHALGDYVEQIRLYGTTDSYSTQPVSFYSSFILGPRTNWLSGGARAPCWKK